MTLRLPPTPTFQLPFTDSASTVLRLPPTLTVSLPFADSAPTTLWLPSTPTLCLPLLITNRSPVQPLTNPSPPTPNQPFTSHFQPMTLHLPFTDSTFFFFSLPFLLLQVRDSEIIFIYCFSFLVSELIKIPCFVANLGFLFWFKMLGCLVLSLLFMRRLSSKF